MAKRNLNDEQSLGHTIAALAVMQSGLGILRGCNVRDIRRTQMALGHLPRQIHLGDNGVPATRVDVFGMAACQRVKVGVMIPDDHSSSSGNQQVQTVNIHGRFTWNWDIQDGKIVLSNGLNLETGKEYLD